MSRMKILILVAATLLNGVPLHAFEDTAPPRILHEIVTKAAVGQKVVITTKIIDDSNIFEPKLYYRFKGDTEFQAIDLIATLEPDTYRAALPAQEATNEWEYFIEAFDEMGNGPTRHGAPAKPHRITIDERPGGQDGVAPTPLRVPTNTGSASGNQGPVVPPQTPPEDDDSLPGWFWPVVGSAIGVVVVGAAVTTGVLLAGGGDPEIQSVTFRVSASDPRGI